MGAERVEDYMHAYVDPDQPGRAAGRVWIEGRNNPLCWEVTTQLGLFTTGDCATWRSESGDWTAEVRRSRHGRHTYLALFERGVYRGPMTTVAGTTRASAAVLNRLVGLRTVACSDRWADVWPRISTRLRVEAEQRRRPAGANATGWSPPEPLAHDRQGRPTLIHLWDANSYWTANVALVP